MIDMRRNGGTSRYIQLFDSFEKIEQNIAFLLKENHDLFRLLKYNENDPLSMPMDSEMAEDMLVDFHSRTGAEGDLQWIINPDCRVFFVPYTGLIESPAKSQLRIYTLQMYPDNIYISDLYVQVDIIVPLALDKIRNGRRRNKIAVEVIKSLNGKEIGLINPLMIVDKPMILKQYRDDYWGYPIIFKTGVAGHG